MVLPSCVLRFLLLDGNSHLWHKKNSVRFTSILGKLACLVCSKILGIGSAERSWGDVKHLKSDKRSKLSGEATKMQGTIFGASCAERARLKAEGKDRGEALKTTWDDDDFADPGLDVPSSAQPTTPKSRVFRAWVEDWERDAIVKQDPVNEARLLQKYGGLNWLDPDRDEIFMSSKAVMHWSPMRGARGYCVMGILESHDPSNPTEEDWEPWVIDPDVLHCLIVDYYARNPTRDLTIVTEDTDNENDVDLAGDVREID